MKIMSQYILAALTGLILIMSGCQEQYELDDLTTPTNVTLTYEIVGVDDENPNGDGSGQVNFIASADHAITFSYDFGDGSDIGVAPDGKISHLFSLTGVLDLTNNANYFTLLGVVEGQGATFWIF